MINNYFGKDEYHASDQIYVHPKSRNSLHLGDMSAALDVDFIQRRNIKTVITAAACMEHICYEPELEVNHVVYSLDDSKSEDIAQHFNPVYELIEKELEEGSVLIHCAAGVSRSATLVIAYLMKQRHLTFHQAIDEVRQSRPKVCPNLGFERQLKEYEKLVVRKNYLSLVLRKGPRTSEESKHQPKRIKEIELPQIVPLGKTQIRNIIFETFFQKREMRISQRARPTQIVQKKEQLEDLSLKLRPLRIRKTKSLVERDKMKTERLPLAATNLSLGAQSVFINRLSIGAEIKTQRLVHRRLMARIPNEPFRV